MAGQTNNTAKAANRKSGAFFESEVDHSGWNNVKMPNYASNRASSFVRDGQKRAI